MKDIKDFENKLEEEERQLIVQGILSKLSRMYEREKIAKSRDINKLKTGGLQNG